MYLVVSRRRTGRARALIAVAVGPSTAPPPTTVITATVDQPPTSRSRPHPTTTKKLRPKATRTESPAERELRKESEAALRACREQTGQTTRQCLDQARRGEAS
jgi:hypothetical protein